MKPNGIAVDISANRIYTANVQSNNVSILNGANLRTGDLSDPHAVIPIAIAVNQKTHRIYVGNGQSNNVTVIDSGIAPTPE